MTRRSFLAAVPFSGALGIAAEAKKLIRITGLDAYLLRGRVVLRLLTDAGITGWGWSRFGVIAGGPEALKTILEGDVKAVVISQDPAFPAQIRADLRRSLDYRGFEGLTRFAMSVVDIAVWDILGKAAGLPVYKMLGAVRHRMPAYASLNGADRSAIDETLEKGYRAFKIKVGKFSLEDDVERIEVARKVAGKDIRILVDAGLGFNRAEALRRGRVYQELGCFWYEGALPPWDLEGYTELAHALDIRIVGVDVVQPDNPHASGPTDWMEIAASQGAGVELASRAGGPVAMNMLCAIPNAIYIETDGSERVVKGEALAPETPGMGSEVRVTPHKALT